MVKVKDHEGKEFGMDGWLVSNLDIVKKALRSDLDVICAVVGKEGSGKSVLAMQCAHYISPKTFNVDKVCVTAEQFVEQVMKAVPFESIVYDEAMSGLSSGDALTKTTKTLIKMLAEIRQKRLAIFIALPDFFSLHRNIALHRTRFLLHVYMKEGFQRGYFNFFNDAKKNLLYIKGKKFMDYTAEKSNFYGRFVNHYVINEEAYREKKAETLKRYLKEMDIKGNTRDMTSEKRYMDLCGALIQYIHLVKKEKLTNIRERMQKEIGYPLAKETFNSIRRNFLEKRSFDRSQEQFINTTVGDPAASNISKEEGATNED